MNSELVSPWEEMQTEVLSVGLRCWPWTTVSSLWVRLRTSVAYYLSLPSFLISYYLSTVHSPVKAENAAKTEN